MLVLGAVSLRSLARCRVRLLGKPYIVLTLRRGGLGGRDCVEQPSELWTLALLRSQPFYPESWPSPFMTRDSLLCLLSFLLVG